MPTVDISSLPAPQIIESLSFEGILDDCKADFIARHPAAADVIGLESEPVVKLLETFAYRELLLRARYNDEAQAVLLAFSTGTDLDHIGATYYRGEARLLITPADPDVIPPVEAVYESDDEFRYRLSLKPASYSVAGPRDAFKFHALSADGQVKDANPTTPYGGTTEVFILSRNGDGTPDAPLLATVLADLNDETIRPLSEEVLVSPVAIVNYAIEVQLTIFPGPSEEVVLNTVNANLAAFADAHHKIAADIIHSAIDAAAHISGVKKVVIVNPPADVVCGNSQAPYCTGITVTIAGVEA